MIVPGLQIGVSKWVPPKGVVRRLQMKCFAVTVWNRSPGTLEALLQAGARATASPVDAVSSVGVTRAFDYDRLLDKYALSAQSPSVGAVTHRDAVCWPQEFVDGE